MVTETETYRAPVSSSVRWAAVGRSGDGGCEGSWVHGSHPADAPSVPAHRGRHRKRRRARAGRGGCGQGRAAGCAALSAPPRAPRFAEVARRREAWPARPPRRRPWPRWWSIRGSGPATTAATATPRRARRPAVSVPPRVPPGPAPRGERTAGSPPPRPLPARFFPDPSPHAPSPSHPHRRWRPLCGKGQQ